jgi:hypothetical protein
MKQRRGENKSFKYVETGHFKRECPEGESVGNCSLSDL